MAKSREDFLQAKREHQKNYEKKTGYAAQAKYTKENTRQYIIRVMKNTELDIIEWLDRQVNKSGYIKSLIRADMNKQNQEDN